jgi:hypothetical protein
MGPACGLTSCVRVVEEEDATAFVEAITDSSEGREKDRIVGKVGLIVAACTWQGSEGRQHQIEGKKEDGEGESEGNWRLVTIFGTYYCSWRRQRQRIIEGLGFRPFRVGTVF